MAELHICAPTTFPSRAVMHCRTCRQRRRVVVYHHAWYDPYCRCTACGESPYDRARFKRVTAARRKKIRGAKDDYQRATTFREAMRRMSELGVE